MSKTFFSKLWLTFAQAVTICFGILFAIKMYAPDFLHREADVKTPIQINEIRQAPPDSAATPTDSYSRAVKKAIPSVVNIYTSKKVAAANPHQKYFDDPLFRHFFGDQFDESDKSSQPENSLGSGVIVSENGLILTNHHVVATADAIEVALSDGKKLSAKIVGTDPETDLALLKVDATALPAITFASADHLNIGDVVLAIGNPFGVGQTVTQGIVSALGRNHLGINTFENFIQTDASINPGNSGGALIDANGNLVGINSAIYSQSGGSMGIGFAIPVSIAKQVLEQIAANGNVTRGWIGIEAQDLTPELAESFKLTVDHGALIAGVLRNSPADKAGLKPGDILLEIDQKPVFDSASMLNVVAVLKPNQTSKAVVYRDGKNLEVSILIGTRPKPIELRN
jgi:serine protease DegQ